MGRQAGTDNPSDPRTRLEVLRGLLSSGVAGTQDELRDKLESQGFNVTQSTISRDLRRLGAVRVIDDGGRAVYRFAAQGPAPLAKRSLNDLILSIDTNNSIIVVRTTPGSAPLVAAHIDHYRPGGILGTIAGDDTIFVAPATLAAIPATIEQIRDSLLSEE